MTAETATKKPITSNATRKTGALEGLRRAGRIVEDEPLEPAEDEPFGGETVAIKPKIPGNNFYKTLKTKIMEPLSRKGFALF
jgi:hypothetical protein